MFRGSKYSNVKFQVDNARAGQTYHSKISMISPHDVTQINFIAESFIFAEQSFYFDENSQTIMGEPKEADTLDFSFDYVIEGQTYTTHCKLIVIADPRSLWKVIEPASGQKFAKPHSAKSKIEHKDYKLIAASRRGRSHEHAGLFRDDDFSILSIENSDWSVLTVADGAGSAEYSREGSRIAVDIVSNKFKSHFDQKTIEQLTQGVEQWQIAQQDNNSTEVEKKINLQFKQIYFEIYQSILEQIELTANELGTSTKDFSTTLLVAAVCKLPTKTFISTFSVGDGVIAVYSNNNIHLMNVADGGEYAGQTKFLDKNICNEFDTRLKMGWFSNTDAVLLMTDGISDPLFETDSGLFKLDKWQKLYRELDPLMQIEAADTALLEWMHFFIPRHHDDRTMAVIWNKH